MTQQNKKVLQFRAFLYKQNPTENELQYNMVQCSHRITQSLAVSLSLYVAALLTFFISSMF